MKGANGICKHTISSSEKELLDLLFSNQLDQRGDCKTCQTTTQRCRCIPMNQNDVRRMFDRPSPCRALKFDPKILSGSMRSRSSSLDFKQFHDPIEHISMLRVTYDRLTIWIFLRAWTTGAFYSFGLVPK